jgi:hypothetical protein
MRTSRKKLQASFRNDSDLKLVRPHITVEVRTENESGLVYKGIVRCFMDFAERSGTKHQRIVVIPHFPGKQ